MSATPYQNSWDSTKCCSASAQSSGATPVSVSTATQLLPATTTYHRKVMIITNCDASASLYVGIGFTPTSTNYTYKLAAGGSIQSDMAMMQDQIMGVASTGTINVNVYEGI